MWSYLDGILEKYHNTLMLLIKSFPYLLMTFSIEVASLVMLDVATGGGIGGSTGRCECNISVAPPVLVRRLGFIGWLKPNIGVDTVVVMVCWAP